MTHIIDAILAPATGAFFYDDQKAIAAGLQQDGFDYVGAPMTAGFRRVRMPAAALSIGLQLSDGAIVWGDMVSVQYSGAAGRDRVFDTAAMAALCRDVVTPRLRGLQAATAARNCDQVFDGGEPLPIAVRYGVSQALLRAAAHAGTCTMAEIICDTFDQPPPLRPVPLFSQSGDERYLNVDKMILKGVDVLPHGLVNSRDKFGPEGETFLEYVRWVTRRVEKLGPAEYRPTLHFDMYGWIGYGIGGDPGLVADFIGRIAEAAGDHVLHVESPVDYGERQQQIEQYAALLHHLERLGIDARIVADEHCNTLEDIRAFCDARAAHIVQVKTPDVGSVFDTARAIAYAKNAHIGAYSGGSSAETDLSARACVHVALAMQASMMLAKPGMGVDEGIAIVRNEQSRILAEMHHRHGAGAMA